MQTKQGDEDIEVRVAILKGVYSKLHSALYKIPKKNRVERIRQLAMLGEMVEAGLIFSSHTILIEKDNSAYPVKIPSVDIKEREVSKDFGVYFESLD